jgi:hypothetical protein
MNISSLHRFAPACAVALWSSAALAEATEEGAARLAGMFPSVVASTEGVLSVAIDGEAYRVTLDLNPLLNAGPTAAAGSTTTISKIAVTVTDNGDGTWGFSVDQPLSWSSVIPGTMTAGNDYGRFVLTGTYDEKLGDVSAYRLQAEQILTGQSQNDPAFGQFFVRGTQDIMTWEGTVTAGDAGLDSRFVTANTNIAYEVRGLGQAPDSPPVFSITFGEVSGSGGTTGYDPKTLYPLLGMYFELMIRTPEEVDRPAIKATLEAALPVFQHFDATGTYQDISVVTPVGTVGMDALDFSYDMTGAVPDGRVRQAYGMKGLTLPDGLLPPWAVPLVPSDASLDVAVAGLDLAAAAQLGLDLLGLPPLTPPPAAFGDQMLTALLPEGVGTITLAPGETKAPAYRLTYEGAMTVGPTQPAPVTRARIGLTGMDDIEAALQAAPAESGIAGSTLALATARMLAKPGSEGELVWEIETDASGAVRVNGQDVAGGAP